MIRTGHAVLAAVVAFALIGQTAVVVDQDRSLVNLVSYFTIQSNILVLIASVMLAIRPERSGTPWAVFRIAGLVGITVTGLVYATVLRNGVDFDGIEWWYDKIFHYVCPVAAVLGWLLLVPRTRFAWNHVLWFILWPIAWLAYTVIRGTVFEPRFAGVDADSRSHYPYPFLDVDDLGGGRVALNSVVVTVLFVAICAAYVWLSGYFDRSKQPADLTVT